MKLRVFTAFSGYDSQCLALERIKIYCAMDYWRNHPHLNDKTYYPFDYELVGWSEIDKYAIKAHNALFPQWADRNYGDISKIDWDTVPDFDLFTYSSPCQDFSQAGKQRGGAKGSGTRSSLLWECERAIATKKPKYLLMENVAALVSKFIKLFNEWQLTLERLGYTNFTQVLNAKTHGYPAPVPQNRERVFMVSILNCEEPFYFPEPQTLTTRLKDVLEPNVDEKYYLKDSQIDMFISHSQKQREKGNMGFANSFNPTDGGGGIGKAVLTHNGQRPADNYIKVAGMLPDDGRHESARRVYSPDGIAPTQNTCGGGGLETKIVLGWTRDAKGKVVDRHPVEVANTVTSTKRDNTQNYVLEL